MTSNETLARVRLVTTELIDCVAEADALVEGPAVAAREICRQIGVKDREHFVVLYLDARHRIVATETVSVGTLSAALVHPREVFKGAIISNAAAIICGHNHPSGELSPSSDDLQICERLSSAGELLGINVLDFLIVSGEEWESFKELGELS